MSSIPGLGRSPGRGNGNPFQYSCPGNLMDRGAWQATVREVAKNWTQLSTHEHTFLYIFGSNNILSGSDLLDKIEPKKLRLQGHTEH